MKLARHLTRTPALVAMVVASAASLGISGCGDTRACKSGTLFVSVDFVGAALDAEKLNVDVKPEGDPIRTDTFDHTAGSAEGSVEIDFPNGYQAGHHVLIVFTARKAGMPVALVTASVVLSSGCSSLSVQLGGGVFDGGPSDAPADSSAGSGGRGGGAGGAGVGGVTGTGGGAGGTIDAGVDTGCVFKSAEDCFNGVDDDCNGHVDCDDPACGASTTCVPAAGANGFVPGAWIDPSGACPVRFDGGESTINSTLDPGAGCTGCSCDAPITCSANLYKYASQLACTTDIVGSPTGGTLAGGITATLAGGAATPTTSCLASTFDTTTEARVGMYVASNGACTPHGTAKPSAAAWGKSRKFCSAGSVGAGCSPGYVCVPRAAPNYCVMALGAKSCPAGYTRDPGPWYTGFSDTRTCSACRCGTQSPGSCSPLQVAFYFGSTTTCSAGIHRGLSSNTNNCSFGGPCGSAGFTGTPTAPVCPAVSSPGGALTATGEQTLCCF